METITKIALDLLTLKEDKPHIIIADIIIQDYIEEHMDELIEEVKEEMSKY